ncbi:MAG: PTS sugar transporter subunit IIA, partial [Nitrospinota bacterium]|nr:PTS sugar transporter subunit IIA [Nitrospinota bacterium]
MNVLCEIDERRCNRMKITEYLTKEMIAVDLRASGKEEAIAAMVDHIVAQGGVDSGRRGALIDKLTEREALGSTGVGGGVAIPHASGEDMEKMMVAIGKFSEGVDYDAIDGKPVNLVFMIVGPTRQPRAHLQLLAAIVRTLRNKPLLQSIQ